ncbi:hypothetical protein AB6A40_008912 [Gnathostoma spinigerum]|uniref:Uncharacterized protein n=1 Tax=Gnathostoma spinigerum TaxID=75299 RepID=A0ABD6EQS9_9BILA
MFLHKIVIPLYFSALHRLFQFFNPKDHLIFIGFIFRGDLHSGALRRCVRATDEVRRAEDAALNTIFCSYIN